MKFREKEATTSFITSRSFLLNEEPWTRMISGFRLSRCDLITTKEWTQKQWISWDCIFLGILGHISYLSTWFREKTHISSKFHIVDFLRCAVRYAAYRKNVHAALYGALWPSRCAARCAVLCRKTRAALCCAAAHVGPCALPFFSSIVHD